jgi:hypothetical protein
MNLQGKPIVRSGSVRGLHGGGALRSRLQWRSINSVQMNC